jgi:hypothetical protein
VLKYMLRWVWIKLNDVNFEEHQNLHSQPRMIKERPLGDM